MKYGGPWPVSLSSVWLRCSSVVIASRRTCRRSSGAAVARSGNATTQRKTRFFIDERTTDHRPSQLRRKAIAITSTPQAAILSCFDDLLPPPADVPGGVARVHYLRGIRDDHSIVDRAMVGQNQHCVVPGNALRRDGHRFHFVVEAVLLLEPRDVGVVVLDLRAALLEQADHAKRRALAHVVDVPLVGGAENEQAGSVQGLGLVGEGPHRVGE